MLLIFFPVTSVFGSVQVTVGSESMCLIVLPEAVIDITVCMDQSTFTIGLIVCPVALIHGAIGPDLNTFTLADLGVTEPLALVLRAIFKDDHLADLALA